MRRLLLALALTVACVAAARAQIWIMSPASQMRGHGTAPVTTGKILLVDGVSFVLQTDGTSKICRAGGC